MSIVSEYFFPSSDGRTLIHVNQWTPAGREIAGVVQIAHGVAEYGRRYEPFARFLCRHGFVVTANDHLGHGLSRMEGAPMVYLGEEDGWWHVVDDMEELREKIIAADVVLLASPMYYFGISAQIKAVIDRFFAFNPHVTGKKDAYLFVTYGGDDPKTAEGITRQYEITCDFLKWTDRGKILVANVNDEGDVLKTAYPQQAYELGKSLK